MSQKYDIIGLKIIKVAATIGLMVVSPTVEREVVDSDFGSWKV